MNAQKARAVAEKVGLIPDGNWKWALRKLKDNKGNPLIGEKLEKARIGLGAMSEDSFAKLRKAQAANPDKEIGYQVSKSGDIHGVFRGKDKTIALDITKIKRGQSAGYMGHTHPHHQDFGSDIHGEKPYHVTQMSGIHDHKDFLDNTFKKRDISDSSYSVDLRKNLRKGIANGHLSTERAGEYWEHYSPKTYVSGLNGRDIKVALMHPTEYNKHMRISRSSISNTSLGVETLHRLVGVHHKASDEAHLLKLRQVFLKHQGK